MSPVNIGAETRSIFQDVAGPGPFHASCGPPSKLGAEPTPSSQHSGGRRVSLGDLEPIFKLMLVLEGVHYTFLGHSA